MLLSASHPPANLPASPPRPRRWSRSPVLTHLWLHSPPTPSPCFYFPTVYPRQNSPRAFQIVGQTESLTAPSAPVFFPSQSRNLKPPNWAPFPALWLFLPITHLHAQPAEATCPTHCSLNTPNMLLLRVVCTCRSLYQESSSHGYHVAAPSLIHLLPHRISLCKTGRSSFPALFFLL